MKQDRQERRPDPAPELDPSLPEMAVIGYILLYPGRMHQCAVVAPHHFSDQVRGSIWQLLRELVDIHGTGVTPAILSEKIVRNGVMKSGEVMDFLVDCQDHARNAADPESAGSAFCTQLVDGGLRRRMKSTAGILAEMADGAVSTEEMRCEMQAEVFGLLQYETSSNLKPLAVVLDDELRRLSQPFQEGPQGLMTGIRAFDELFNGFTGGDLVVIGARPSVGKTSLATQLAIEWGLRQEVPGGIWSLEMGLDKLIPRLACQITGLDSHRIGQNAFRAGELKLTLEAVQQMKAAESKKTLQMMDTRRLDGRSIPKSITDVVAEIRHWKNRMGLKWVIVDYIQRIAGIKRRGESREREVASVSSMLKQVAVEADIIVVAVSAIGRPNKDYVKRRPTMYELRESGQIEYDADLIMLLHNWYLVNHDPEKPMKRLDRETSEIIMAKNRNGPTGIAQVDFVPSCCKWEEKTIGSSGGEDYPWQGQQG